MLVSSYLSPANTSFVIKGLGKIKEPRGGGEAGVPIILDIAVMKTWDPPPKKNKKANKPCPSQTSYSFPMLRNKPANLQSYAIVHYLTFST